ncbi:DUF7661 family protein [Biformimicrobium ophioploci]|uniref:DUF7661 domain-containing protein n=1 Tax=Biformimicrobium ophioploci TaxID=3036711 RepID=A0ABQ6LYL1_9GAMM|nr:hypothetical protein MNKW57_14480 [Microbulbifer sp. NKW57]
MKLDVYGKEVEVIRSDSRWCVYYLGAEGKKRIAQDLNIPSDLPESEVMDFLADLCHEWAGPGRVEVIRIR